MPCRASQGSAPEFGTAASWRAADALARPPAPQPALQLSSAHARANRVPEGAPAAASSPTEVPQAAAQAPSRRHPVFCGAYGALQCEATDAATQAMLHVQALAVADLALRDLVIASSNCGPSCTPASAGRACAAGHSAAPCRATSGPDSAALMSDEHNGSLTRPSSQPRRRWAALSEDPRVFVGYSGEHIEAPSDLLPMWDRVRTADSSRACTPHGVTDTYRAPAAWDYCPRCLAPIVRARYRDHARQERVQRACSCQCASQCPRRARSPGAGWPGALRREAECPLLRNLSRCAACAS